MKSISQIDQELHANSHSQKQASLILNAFVFLAGVLGVIGVVFRISLLYSWGINGATMHIQTALSIICLAIGFFIITTHLTEEKPIFRYIAMFLFFVALGVGLFETMSFLQANQLISLYKFLTPESPTQGRIPLITGLCLLLSSTIALLDLLFHSDSKEQSLIFVQIPSLLLINLSTFGFIGSLGVEPLAKYLIAKPDSLAFFLYGIALLLFPSRGMQLARPFFASPRIRLLSSILCLGWLGSVMWHTLGWETYIGQAELNIGSVRSLVMLNGLFQVLFSSALLVFGLFTLSSMEMYSITAQKLQEILNNLGVLAAALSHDLKGPIKSEISAIEMIQKGTLGDTITNEGNQALLKTLNESNRFELELVMNLVDLLRYQIKQERFFPEPFKINRLLLEIERELNPLSNLNNQVLRIHQSLNKEESVTADRLGLKRILENLITNAIQHSQEGCCIDVEFQSQNDEVLFSVRDNGTGLTAQAQKKLFKLFTEGNGKKGLPTTSGLGLYIAKRVVEKHGGRIWFESVPKKGSSFFFTIPKLRQDLQHLTA